MGGPLQLRYPNSHTHYFSCLLLYLFGEANTETIQEQVTRSVLFLFHAIISCSYYNVDLKLLAFLSYEGM